jgi:spore maturation protein CgeB
VRHVLVDETLMRILYVGLKYDYGVPAQGYSYEHNNFYDSLINMGHEVLYFDTGSLLKAHGRERMNQRLLEVARNEHAELMFTVLFREELKREVVQEISESTSTVTLNWFCDDHWRFDDYTRYWAPMFNWVVTTANSALPKYQLLGYDNVIKSQWACNHFQYRKLDLPLTFDASFVGMPHGDRPHVVQALRDAGVDVQVWGSGWSSGRVSQDEMIRVFNQSRINLNLSNASQPKSFSAKLSGFLARRLARMPLSPKRRSQGMRIIAALENQHGRMPESRYAAQIKGRNFEVPGCGGFLLTGGAENLGDYYVDGEEVVCFSDRADLVSKVRHYLSNEAERAHVAAAGHRRTLAEHTYVHRFTEIFRRMGLQAQPAAPRPGALQEIS